MDLLLTTVICEKCGTILRPGQEGARVEKKVCMDCVLKTTPAADPNEIKKPLNQEAVIKAMQGIEDDPNYKGSDKYTEKMPITMDATIGRIKDNDNVMLFLEFSDDKKKLIEVGFDKNQLLTFIADIDKYSKDSKINK